MVSVFLDSGKSSLAHEKGRGIEREQLPQQHYVSKAPTSAADGVGSGPSEEEHCTEYQEAVNDEGTALLPFKAVSCAPQGAWLFSWDSVLPGQMDLDRICVDSWSLYFCFREYCFLESLGKFEFRLLC